MHGHLNIKYGAIGVHCRETWWEKDKVSWNTVYRMSCSRLDKAGDIPRIYGCLSSSLISGAVTEEGQLFSPCKCISKRGQDRGGFSSETRWSATNTVVQSGSSETRHLSARWKYVASDAPQRRFCKTRRFLSHHVNAHWKCMASDAPRNTLMGKYPKPEI